MTRSAADSSAVSIKPSPARGEDQKRMAQTRSGAQLLVDALRLHGVDRVFGVPGESYLSVLDAMLDTAGAIEFIVCRQEGGAAYMADAYGKMTGRPGICFVTRGPGACNASIGLHTAFQDSTPMIVLIGQVGTDVLEREGFQEIDYRRMFGPVSKWVAQIDRADRVAEFVSRAFHTATAGRPGPVVLVLPEDMQRACSVPVAARPYTRVAAHPGPTAAQDIADRLAVSKRPLLILGGSGWTQEACRNVASFATRLDLPVVCSFRRQDLFDNRDRHYIGDLSPGMNPALAQRMKDADLLISIGSRLGELQTAGYSLLDIPMPRQKLIHVLPGAEELGRVYQGDLLVNAGLPEFAAALRTLSLDDVAWHDWTASARRDYESWQKPQAQVGTLNLSEVIAYLTDRLPADSIITNGAGNYAIWVHRFYRYTGLRTQLAPTSGAMGYGVPAAVAAKLIAPDRPVVCFAGDGCFMMNGQELATAARYQLKIIFIVVNNGMYGTIRMHQEREYPGRVNGTVLCNPSFTKLAHAYGMHAEFVDRTEDFAAAFERAWAAEKAALIELALDPDAISPRTTISALRAQAKKRQHP
jgi:acetolactate synthase-1/2/3 large subunit